MPLILRADIELVEAKIPINLWIFKVLQQISVLQAAALELLTVMTTVGKSNGSVAAVYKLIQHHLMNHLSLWSYTKTPK